MTYFLDNLLSLKPVNNVLHEVLKEAANYSIIDGDILEFGVYRGESINFISTLFPDKIIYGFDSFEGLPEEWKVSETYTVPKKHFDLGGSLPSVNSNVTLVKGWFSDTIPEYKNKIKNIKYLHIDCDLYSSTMSVFDQLNDKIVKGTVIVFDEFYPFSEVSFYKIYEDGEFKALNDWCSKYSRVVEPLCRSTTEQCAFIVKE